jgi:5-methylcytosine-specific restriction endonuclease McrBC regulatory subunit McrC
LQAIEWTLDDRGLAGLSDLAGIAWRMDMEVFFEAWIEAIAAHAAARTGSAMRVGRREETRVPLDWAPPSTGSQRSLLPDVVMERDDVVLVIDAKYKRHAEQIERLGWHDVDEGMREEHRNDVLQALAYSTLFNAPRTIACLAYPASPRSWDRLVSRGRAVSRARVRSGARHVELALLAVSLSGDVTGPAREIARMVRERA